MNPTQKSFLGNKRADNHNFRPIEHVLFNYKNTFKKLTLFSNKKNQIKNGYS